MWHNAKMNSKQDWCFNPSNAEATFCPKDKDPNIFEKHLNPHVGILWIALIEYFQMSTHVPWFSVIFQVFCIILYQISQ